MYVLLWDFFQFNFNTVMTNTIKTTAKKSNKRVSLKMEPQNPDFLSISNFFLVNNFLIH